MRSAKVMLIGDVGVGKSSLARRLVFDRFDTDYKTTIGVDVLTYDVPLGEEAGAQTMRLVLWDTDGDFGGTIFDTIYVMGATAAIVVADASRPATLLKMSSLADDFAERFPGRPARRVVNKLDLAHDRARLEAAAADRDTCYTSALTGDGVIAMFRSVAADIVRREL